MIHTCAKWPKHPWLFQLNRKGRKYPPLSSSSIKELWISHHCNSINYKNNNHKFMSKFNLPRKTLMCISLSYPVALFSLNKAPVQFMFFNPSIYQHLQCLIHLLNHRLETVPWSLEEAGKTVSTSGQSIFSSTIFSD